MRVRLFADDDIAQIAHLAEELFERRHAFRIWDGVGKKRRRGAEGGPTCYSS